MSNLLSKNSIKHTNIARNTEIIRKKILRSSILPVHKNTMSNKVKVSHKAESCSSSSGSKIPKKNLSLVDYTSSSESE